ncbi:hypothetical protein [Microbacterium maritypicum]
MAEVRKDLVGTVIAVNESEQYTHLVAGDTIPDGYFVGGHAVEDGDPADQRAPWKTAPAPSLVPAPTGDGKVEQMLAAGTPPEDIVAAIAADLGVSLLPASPQPDGDDPAANKVPGTDDATGNPPAPDGELIPPPMSGAGSGGPAWRDYALAATKKAGLEIEIPEDAKRSDIVEALKSANIRVE